MHRLCYHRSQDQKEVALQDGSDEAGDPSASDQNRHPRKTKTEAGELSGVIHLPITMSSRSKDRRETYLEKKDPVLLIFGLS